MPNTSPDSPATPHAPHHGSGLGPPHPGNCEAGGSPAGNLPPGASRLARIVACAPVYARDEPGATLAELRAAYAAAAGAAAPASFAAEVGSLVRHGRLAAVGGRPGRTRYARLESRVGPRAEYDHAFDAAGDAVRGARLDPGDFVGEVLAALRAAQARNAGEPVPAAAVAATLLERRGDGRPATDRAAVTAAARSALHTLARPRRRGPAATRGALARRVADATDGRPLWAAVDRRVDGPVDGLEPPAGGGATSHEASDRGPRVAARPERPGDGPEARFATRTAAVGATVAAAADALGRWPSARDVAWYQDGPGRNGLGVALSVRAQDLASAAHATVTRHRVAGGHGMARACFEADRFAPRAFAPRRAPSTPPRTAPPAGNGAAREDAPANAASEALVHALDAAVERLALAEEREGVARLAVRAARWQNAALGAFAAVREAAARASLEAHLQASSPGALASDAPAPPAAAIQNAVARSRHACDVLDAWIEAARRAGRQHDVCTARRQAVAAHRAHLTAAEWLLGVRPPAGASGRAPADPAAARAGAVAEVGAAWAGAAYAEGAWATTAELAPYAQTAARLGDYPAPRAARLYVRARRAPRERSETAPEGASAGASVPADGSGGAFGVALGTVGRPALPRALPPAAPARVDRVDALACLASAVAASRTPALVRQACALLGAVLRDAGAVRALLAGLPPGDATTRHAAVVALGLLGVAPEWRDAVGAVEGRDAVGPEAGDRVGGDGQDAVAFVVAVALAGPDGDAAAAAVLAARAQAGPAARPVLDAARARLRAGLLLTAAE